MNIFRNMFSNFQFFLQSLLNEVKKRDIITNPKLLRQQLSNIDDKGCEDDIKLSKGEIKIVMERLGMTDYECDGEVGVKELSRLFEEQEASLEEVKEAFDVFDENKDGFIDAAELKRVMCLLGFKEGSEVEPCRRIIRIFDENGDGLIDFNEFLKSMEKCFY